MVLSSTPFFTWEQYDDWKARVLRLLKRKHSRIHKIVDNGCLPIFSLKSNRWFGVTASLAYRYYRCSKYVDIKYRNRQSLKDLLESGRYMKMGVRERSNLCFGHHAGPFSVVLLHDLVIDNNHVHKHLHINNIYPRTQSEWKWLTGGDLLVASGILFALLDVRYMTVGEGPDVRYFENEKRKTHPNYFYYNKSILVPAQSAVVDLEYSSRELEDDESGDESQFKLKHNPNRDANSVMEWWFWDKLAP
jgi:hypothetical protein